MSVGLDAKAEAGTTEAGVPWEVADGSESMVPPVQVRLAGPRIAETSGPAASRRRDALFRRTLLAADATAVATALLLTIALSARTTSMRLTWASLACVPLLLFGAKVIGLYDRDEVLVRKTTLQEVPRLFLLATLSALVAWLAGGLTVAGTLDRKGTLFLWLALAGLLILARGAARRVALRIAPVERCLLIGDSRSAEVIRSKLSGRRGVKAEVVAHLDLKEATPWSADGRSTPRLAEISALARTLDVHRAIVAPHWGGADANEVPDANEALNLVPDANEVLNLVHTLKAIGVRVSVLPRLLEVVGPSVEFDDLHGVTLMGV